MAGTGTKRIIELTEASTIQSGDFIAVDSNARGTKKVPTSALATSAALTAETNARTGADEQMSERMDGIEEQTALIQNPTKTLSGALVSFTDGADMPMVACTAEIVPKQSGTGTPSPENVRAISGWESVSVTDAGKNLFGGTFGTANKYPIHIPSGVSFTVSCKDGGGTTNVYFYDQSQTLIDYFALTSVANSRKYRTFTRSHDIYYFAFGNYDNTEYQIELGTTATAYDPYAGATTTVNLGRTVYGGTLDVVAGVLTVDRAMITLDGTTSWTMGTTSTMRYFNASMSALDATPWDTDILSNLATRQEIGFPYCQITGDKKIRLTFALSDTDYDSVSKVQALLTQTPLTAVYELATPQTYQLTPTEVKTLLGENNVWADSGDVEITYRRDISIVINNLESALNG